MENRERALAVITSGSPVIRALITPESTDLLNRFLGDSGLVAEDLYTDMAAAITLKPALARCTKESLYYCLLFAAKHHASFGMYGVELVPRGIKEEDDEGQATGKKIPTANPQLGYRYKIEAGRKKGVISHHTERVYEGEKFKVITDGGIPVSIEHEIDYTKPRSGEKGLVAAYGIAEMENGRRCYKVLSRADIDRSKARRATKQEGVWKTDYEAQVKKTVEHRLFEFVVGNFTFGRGSGAGQPPPPDGEMDDNGFDADFERMDESAAVAGELESRSTVDLGEPWPEDVPKDMHHAAALHRGFAKLREDGGSLEEYWDHHGKALVNLAGQDERQFMVKMKDELKPPPPAVDDDGQTALPIEPPGRPDLAPEIAKLAATPGVISDALRACQEAYQKLAENEKAVHEALEIRMGPWLERANAEEKKVLNSLGVAMAAPVNEWLKAKAASGGQRG